MRDLEERVNRIEQIICEIAYGLGIKEDDSRKNCPFWISDFRIELNEIKEQLEKYETQISSIQAI